MNPQPKKLTSQEVDDLRSYFLEPPFATEATKEIEQLFNHIQAIEAENEELMEKASIIEKFFRTFPGVGSLLKSAHQHPEHDPCCTYCVLIDAAESSVLTPK